MNEILMQYKLFIESKSNIFVPLICEDKINYHFMIN